MLERDRHTKAGLVREREKKTDGIGKREREREEHRRRERREAIPKKKSLTRIKMTQEMQEKK